MVTSAHEDWRLGGDSGEMVGDSIDLADDLDYMGQYPQYSIPDGGTDNQSPGGGPEDSDHSPGGVSENSDQSPGGGPENSDLSPEGGTY